MVDLSKLNNEQKEAVLTVEGYVRVIASPGSGKTRALTHRFAYLLDDMNISSDNILCITYTNKAANEMKERIINLVNNKNHNFIYISTIHSYCDKLLRQNINKLNGTISSNYDIYDDGMTDRIIKKVVSEFSPISGSKINDLKMILSKAKETHPEYIKYLFGQMDKFSFGLDWLDEILEICKNNNGLFFDDLIYGSLYLLNCLPDVKKNEQMKFKYIMVDEFQDTTPNTYELIKVLSGYHKNLFIVGDPDQSIYEFIGANPNLLLSKFVEDFPSTITLLMNTNYRSTNNIINLSNQLIENNINRYNQKRTIGFNNVEGNKVVYSHFIDRKNQLYNICRIIEHLHSDLKYEYSDIFLIARNNYSFVDIKKELRKNKIPYVNSRTTKKLGSKEEIQLITYYLSYALNQSAFSLYSINEIVNLGINKIEMEKILNVKTDVNKFLDEHKNDKLLKFLASNERIKSSIIENNKKTSEIVQMIIGEYGILERYEPDEDTDYFKEGENISLLLQNIVYNEKINPEYSIYDFLNSIALESSIESEDNKNGVILLTAHGSKGLESKNVIVFDYDKISGFDEGERRLSYVAFTRAKDNLFILSGTKKGESLFAGEFKNLCISTDKYFENIKCIKPIYNLDEEIKELNEEKTKAFNIMLDGKNVFLTGEAGTGKTFLINKYLKYLNKTNKNVLICAPTGIAASNYNGGVTIHKAFGIGVIPSIVSITKTPSTPFLHSIDTLIIDEISMCRIDIFDYIMRCVKKCNMERNKPIQVILCGDFFQLPPVILEYEKSILKMMFPKFKEGFAFESDEWELGNFNNIVLKEIFRQDDDGFIEALNNARRGKNVEKAIDFINKNSSKEIVEKAMEIHSRNFMVNKINSDRLSELSTKQVLYKASYFGVISDNVNIQDELILKPGCKVMLLVNDKELKYQNGSVGTVVTCGDDYIDVIIDKTNSLIRVYEKTFDYVDIPKLNDDGSITQNIIGKVTQIPVKLAYAITIHKSQGQTYDRVNLDPSGWENGQVYVAISRIRGLKGLYLYKPLDKETLKTSKNVIDFYNNII